MALKRIGGLWKKEKNGKKYYTGVIEVIAGQKMNIVCMPYEAKKGEKPAEKAPNLTVLVMQNDDKPKPTESPTSQADI